MTPNWPQKPRPWRRRWSVRLSNTGRLTMGPGTIWAYEVDGYGNVLKMDDANAPGLLSLAYLGVCRTDDPLYRRTRAFALSESNPYFFRGKAAEGAHSRIALVPFDDASKCLPRHKLHHLRKQRLAHVHAALPVVESRKHRK